MKIILKRISLLIAVFLLSALFISCTGNNGTTSEPSSVSQSGTSSAPAESEEPDTLTGTLYAVFSNTHVTTHDFGYPEGDLTVDRIAEALTALTGLAFDIVSYTDSETGNITVEWQNNSALISDLGEGEQKEDFRFYDYDTLAWFMMNSLCRTILENIDNTIEVFYTMEGGDPLELENLPDLVLTPGTPYNRLTNSSVALG